MCSIIQRTTIHRVNEWDRLFFFFQGCLPRISGFTLPARPRGAGGVTRETDKIDKIFSTFRARRVGHGERAKVRIATGGPRSIPRRARRAAQRSAWHGRRGNGPPVGKKHYFTLLKDSPRVSGIFSAGRRKLACHRG